MAAVVTRAAGGRVLGLAAVTLAARLLGRDAARFKDLHLAVGELAPRTLGHILELQAGEVAAVQADHRMVNLAQHALNLIFAALADDDLHGGGAGLDALGSYGLGLARVNDSADRRLA